jgi:hypothetical protein
VNSKNLFRQNEEHDLESARVLCHLQRCWSLLLEHTPPNCVLGSAHVIQVLLCRLTISFIMQSLTSTE